VFGFPLVAHPSRAIPLTLIPLDPRLSRTDERSHQGLGTRDGWRIMGSRSAKDPRSATLTSSVLRDASLRQPRILPDSISVRVAVICRVCLMREKAGARSPTGWPRYYA